MIQSSFMVLLGTIIYKLGFFLKEIVLTAKLGISHELTIFLSAFLIPSFICNCLTYSLPVSTSFQLVKDQNKISLSLLQNITTKVMGFSLGIYFILYFSIPFIFPLFTPDEISLVQSCSLISLPFFVFMPIRWVLGQVLYLRNYHLVNLLISLISPFYIIGCLYFVESPTAKNLMTNVMIGSFIELMVTALIAYSIDGINIHEKKSSMSTNNLLNGFTLQIFLMAPLMIHQIFAHFKGPEFLAIYNYAIKIPNIITTMSMMITSSVLLPYFINNQDFDFQKALKNKKTLFAGIGFLVFCILTPYLSPLIVKLAYERGKFTTESSFQVSHIQTFYFWTIPISAVFLTYIRFLNSKNKDMLAVKLSGMVTLMTLIFCLSLSYLKRLDLIPFTILASYLITWLAFIIKLPLIFKERNV